jgi:hypothetical protein
VILMQRQIVQRDTVTGRAIVTYVDCGPARPNAQRAISPIFTTSNHGHANVSMAGGGKVQTMRGKS